MFLIFQNQNLRPSHKRSIAAMGRFCQLLHMILKQARARSNKRSIAAVGWIVANWHMIANPYAHRPRECPIDLGSAGGCFHVGRAI